MRSLHAPSGAYGLSRSAEPATAGTGGRASVSARAGCGDLACRAGRAGEVCRARTALTTCGIRCRRSRRCREELLVPRLAQARDEVVAQLVLDAAGDAGGGVLGGAKLAQGARERGRRHLLSLEGARVAGIRDPTRVVVVRKKCKRGGGPSRVALRMTAKDRATATALPQRSRRRSAEFRKGKPHISVARCGAPRLVAEFRWSSCCAGIPGCCGSWRACR